MNKNKLNNIIFITILLIISITFLFCMFRNKNNLNFIDNRSSYKFTIPTFRELINGEYQSNLDETIADQMPKYNYFKILYLKINNYTNIGTVKVFKLDKLNKYVKLSNTYLYNDYLLYTTSNTIGDKNNISEINKIIDNTSANIYVYYINTDANYNFEKNFKVDDYSIIKKYVNTDNTSEFTINSFDEYKKYFYKTDHHWNYKGSYKAFNDIAKLMDLDVIPDNNSEVCLNGYFDGSKLKSIANIDIVKDDICIYDFKLPSFDIYISNELVDDYGTSVEKLKTQSELTYGSIYGFDYGEIRFINKDIDNNKKLLIYSNSYSNAVNKLLASNYKETYVIDGRHYKSNKSIVDYIEENNIDDVLILGNHWLFVDNLNW